MSGIRRNPITGEYEYDDYGYMRSTLTKTFNPAKEYYEELTQVRQLPTSPLQHDYPTDKRRYFDLSKIPHQKLNSDKKKFGMNKENYHEKAWPTRIGIEDKNGIYVPHYFRDFPMASEIEGATDKVIANMICGRIFPTKMPYYAGRYNGIFGTVGIDLNHIDGVKSLRLDKYLESKGIALDSVVDLVQAYRSGAFNDELTGSAIAQLMLGMFSIPNAIGEQDPNIRNAILLGPDQKGAKYDSVVRIDFEKNVFNDDQALQGDTSFYLYPFGIFHREESKAEFKENLDQALKDKILTAQDVNLILALNDVTKVATSSDNIQQAAVDANATQVSGNQDDSILHAYFSRDALNNFAKKVITHAQNYTTDIKDTFLTAARDADKIVYADMKELPSLER